MSGAGIKVDVQLATAEAAVPAAEFIARCVERVFTEVEGELVVRIVDRQESAELNQQYRGKSGPTNVLAFPAGEVPGLPDGPKPLGDIAVCAAVVADEAQQQGKLAEAHWAHILIHGCLHLLGYDHMTDEEAEQMEARERAVLAGFGIADPYAAEA